MPSYGNDEGMTNTHTTKAQAMMEFEAQSELRSSLFVSLVWTAGEGESKYGTGNWWLINESTWGTLYIGKDRYLGFIEHTQSTEILA